MNEKNIISSPRLQEKREEWAKIVPAISSVYNIIARTGIQMSFGDLAHYWLIQILREDA